MVPNKERKMTELGALIKLKLAQEKYDEAERLSAELLEVAESDNTTSNHLTSDPAAAVLGALAVSTVDEQVIRNQEHLKLLSLFHTIIGIGTALYSSLFLFHVSMGIAMLSNTHFFGGAPADRTAALFFIGFGSVLVLSGWLLGFLTYYSGRCIKARKHFNFSFILAAVNCLIFPLGTLLGVFTIMVLNRPSIKALYRQH